MAASTSIMALRDFVGGLWIYVEVGLGKDVCVCHKHREQAS